MNLRQVFGLIVWTVLLLAGGALQAQRPGGTLLGGGASRGSSGQGGSGAQNQRETLPDTFGLYQFTVDNPNEELPFGDSLLTDFQQYDPTRRTRFDYRQLGILGSAHQPVVYEPWLRRGLALGWRQFDLYQITGRSLRFYRLQRPYTHLGYVQGSEQADGYLTAQFSRNFADGINFVLDYSSIAQTGQTDQYPNQRNRNTALALGLWTHSRNDRYDGYFSYTANTINQEDNGGVRIPPTQGGEFSTPSSAAVFLDNGRTRHAHRELMYTQYYRLGGGTDSLGAQRRAYTLAHQVVYNESTYKFQDAYTAADTFFYQWYPALFNDPRGARYFTTHNWLENSFRISTFKLADRSAARNQRDLLEVGLTHRYNAVSQEPADTVVNNLLLTGKLGLRPGPRLRLLLDGQLDLWDQAGDYRLTGELWVDLGEAGQLQLRANSQLYQATLLQQRHWLTQQPVWQRNDLNRTLETNLGGAYRLPRWQLEVGLHYHLLNNYIYFDTTGLPTQTGVPVSIGQLTFSKDFHWGPMVLRNTAALQQSSSEVLRLPALFAKHSLFYAGRVLRNLEIQAGIEVRYLTRYRADYYNPHTGQFNLQNRQETPFFPNADLFFNMKVSRFRAFVKWENATTALRPGEWLYLTSFYPSPDGALRIGLKWRMLD